MSRLDTCCGWGARMLLRSLAGRVGRRADRVKTGAEQQVVAALADCGAVDDLRRRVRDAIAARVHATRIAIFESVDGGTTYRATWSEDEALPNPNLVLPGRGRLARWLRVNAEPLLVDPDGELYAWWSPAEREFLAEARLCVPFVASGRLMAFAWVAAAGPLPVEDDGRLEDLEVFARHAAARWAELDRASRAGRTARALHRSQQLSIAGQLAATVSHEVRNPLAAVRSLVQFVRDADPEVTERTRILDGVIEEVDRIETTLGRHLDLSRTYASATVEIDARAMAEDVVAFVGPYATRRGVDLHSCPADAPLRVRVDPAELRQVFLNVLLNACQACATGGHVTVSAAVREDQGGVGVAEITVADDGAGIAAGDQARVFQPFFTTRPDGSGLGLSFCRDALARCGGTIGLSSTPGCGTTVMISIPLITGHGVDPDR
jgi:signal transduction histidine kinase